MEALRGLRLHLFATAAQQPEQRQPIIRLSRNILFKMCWCVCLCVLMNFFEGVYDFYALVFLNILDSQRTSKRTKLIDRFWAKSSAKVRWLGSLTAGIRRQCDCTELEIFGNEQKLANQILDMSEEMDLVYCHVLQFIILIAEVRKEPSELRDYLTQEKTLRRGITR